MSNSVTFDNGAAYEQYMGKWSQLVGEAFLEWLAPAPARDWLDVGCGNGAFTELFAGRCEPGSIAGIDPSQGMLNFARGRSALSGADLRQGDAMALPYAAQSFDVAVMPLVIFFVPEPATGVAEMARVLRPGGSAAAYAWDMDGGGFPYAMLHAEMNDFGMTMPMAPSPEASRLDVMQSLWKDAGFQDIETRAITVERGFASMDEYWRTILGGPSVGALLAALSPGDVERLKDRLRARLPADGTGRIAYSSRANAIKGKVPT